MNRDVFLSLLALDAYNRGYGQNVKVSESDADEGVDESGRAIGTATIILQSDVFSGLPRVEAGFYAIAYEWNGETIISYRGTNFEIKFDTVQEAINSPLIKDVWNGWTVGAGFSQASQASLAIN